MVHTKVDIAVSGVELKDMNLLILARGCPGSGKSTLVKSLQEHFKCDICSADNWFLKPTFYNGAITGIKYDFDKTQLHIAHKNCQTFAEALMVANSVHKTSSRSLIIIDNTNIDWKSCKPYVELAIKYGYDVLLLEPNTPWKNDIDELTKRNIHQVPKETIERMMKNYQSNDYIYGKIAELRKECQNV